MPGSFFFVPSLSVSGKFRPPTNTTIPRAFAFLEPSFFPLSGRLLLEELELLKADPTMAAFARFIEDDGAKALEGLLPVLEGIQEVLVGKFPSPAIRAEQSEAEKAKAKVAGSSNEIDRYVLECSEWYLGRHRHQRVKCFRYPYSLTTNRYMSTFCRIRFIAVQGTLALDC